MSQAQDPQDRFDPLEVAHAVLTYGRRVNEMIEDPTDPQSLGRFDPTFPTIQARIGHISWTLHQVGGPLPGIALILDGAVLDDDPDRVTVIHYRLEDERTFRDFRNKLINDMVPGYEYRDSVTEFIYSIQEELVLEFQRDPNEVNQLTSIELITDYVIQNQLDAQTLIEEVLINWDLSPLHDQSATKILAAQVIRIARECS